MSAISNKTMMILGVTGSVGEQAVDVARKNGVRVTGISARSNVERTEALAREFGVEYCAMADERAAADLKVRLSDTSIKVLAGGSGDGCSLRLCTVDTVKRSDRFRHHEVDATDYRSRSAEGRICHWRREDRRDALHRQHAGRS